MTAQAATAQTETHAINGVDIGKLRETIEVIKDKPFLADFKFRIENKWQGGGLNQTTVKASYGAGQEFPERDGKFTLLEAECLGACGYAPMMQIGPYYFENLSRADVDAILEALRRDAVPPVAPAGYLEMDGVVPERGSDGRAIPTASEAIAKHLAVPPAPRPAGAETAPAGTKEEGQ